MTRWGHSRGKALPLHLALTDLARLTNTWCYLVYY